jgi:heme-degrading monooxygenase HmoA
MNKKETLEEVAEQFKYADGIYGFKQGAKWQQERSYSEEEVYNLLCQFPNREELDDWFELNKKK